MINTQEYNCCHISGLHFYKYFINEICTDICQTPLSLYRLLVKSLAFSILPYQLCVSLVIFDQLSTKFVRNQKWIKKDVAFKKYIIHN